MTFGQKDWTVVLVYEPAVTLTLLVKLESVAGDKI